MKKDILLHIGTTKTGNTSIHQSLAHAKINGHLGQVCYPLWRGDLHQARMAAMYCPDELRTILPSLRERYPSREKSFRRMLLQYRKFIFKKLQLAERAIVSAETFSYLFSSMHAELLREDLEALGYTEFHIIMYVRDPADFYLSSMSQSLRMSDVPPFIQDPMKFRYEFLRMAETWEHVFPGQLIVRRFPADPHEDVLDDYSSLLEQRMGIALPRLSVRKNTTFSTEAMQILQDYRQTFWPDNGGLLTLDSGRLVNLLRQTAHDLIQTRPVLKPNLAEKIRANHKEDADRLFARWGVDLNLNNHGSSTEFRQRRHYCVDDIVESVDREIVHQLLLRLVKHELDRYPMERSQLLQIAVMFYRNIPSVLRPERLHSWLKKAFQPEQSRI